MQSNLKPMAVKLPESDRDRLKKLGELKKRSTHWLMRDAVSQYLDREKQRNSSGRRLWPLGKNTSRHLNQ